MTNQLLHRLRRVSIVGAGGDLAQRAAQRAARAFGQPLARAGLGGEAQEGDALVLQELADVGRRREEEAVGSGPEQALAAKVQRAPTAPSKDTTRRPPTTKALPCLFRKTKEKEKLYFYF